ncbi:hypothetical protein M0813_28172 [Anaeramoeba flamelloides]|uniref:Uncharacterized protein n=1 Tax=Anaeramoeba flamelloides TaxID=1746091 RepID=A0ABQ8XVP1_9EUKA|nr:hypothetical protein M0813_28172 [Anaeramoeba flamelloides]
MKLATFDPWNKANLMINVQGIDLKELQSSSPDSSLDRQEFPISSKSIAQTLNDRYANRKIRTFSVSSSIGIALASVGLPLSTNLTNLSNLPNDNVYFIESLNPDNETFQSDMLNKPKLKTFAT